MASKQPSDEAQFIVVPRTTRSSAGSKSLAELRQVAVSRQITVVRTVGPDEQPERLIICGSRAVLAELREHYAQELCFEEDHHLSPIGRLPGQGRS